MIHIEAVFEHGVLRPLEPLSLRDRQHVMLTIADTEGPGVVNMRQAEQDWLRVNASEYRGQWLALDGNRLVSHGSDARAVHDEAHAKGVERPLMVRVPQDLELPSAGWL